MAETLEGEFTEQEVLEGEFIEQIILEGEFITLTILEGGIEIMKIKNLSLPRGDGRTYRLEVKHENANVKNITGSTVRFTVKEKNNDADPGVMQLSSNDATQIDIDDPGNGKALIYVKNVHTQNLEIRSFIYDVQVVDSSGAVRTVVGGNFTITEDASRTVP